MKKTKGIEDVLDLIWDDSYLKALSPQSWSRDDIIKWALSQIKRIIRRRVKKLCDKYDTITNIEGEPDDSFITELLKGL